MNANLKIRVTQLAGLLLLAAWWMTSAQPASARPLPPGDPMGLYLTPAGTRSAPAPAAALIVHEHPSAAAYLLVAALAVAVTLAAVLAFHAMRRASSSRQAKQLSPA